MVHGWNIFSELSPTFASLHTLKIVDDSWFASGFFKNAPVLENLTLSGVTLRSLHVQWQEIRFLELEGFVTTASKIIAVLCTTPQLETLILACAGKPAAEAAHITEAIVPALLPCLHPETPLVQTQDQFQRSRISASSATHTGAGNR